MNGALDICKEGWNFGLVVLLNGFFFKFIRAVYKGEPAKFYSLRQFWLMDICIEGFCFSEVGSGLT